MSTIEKRLKKFYRKPIPNDVTFEEIETLARYFGCEVRAGGKHGKTIIHRPSGTVIPIPYHGKHVKEAYVRALKSLFNAIEEGEI